MVDRTRYAPAENLRRGGYVLWESHKNTLPEAIFIGTGSECEIALIAGEMLAEEGIVARVVSLPSWELFDAQPVEYRNEVLPQSVSVRIAVEAGITLGWEHYIGREGRAIGMKTFGASAPAGILYDAFGITVEAALHAAHELLEKKGNV